VEDVEADGKEVYTNVFQIQTLVSLAISFLPMCISSGVRMRYKLYEWDCDNGDMLYREYYESRKSALAALKEYIKDAKRDGWECEWIDANRVICSKCEEGECYQRELGVEPA
jgi:hypothetical protein